VGFVRGSEPRELTRVFGAPTSHIDRLLTGNCQFLAHSFYYNYCITIIEGFVKSFLGAVVSVAATLHRPSGASRTVLRYALASLSGGFRWLKLWARRVLVEPLAFFVYQKRVSFLGGVDRWEHYPTRSLKLI